MKVERLEVLWERARGRFQLQALQEAGCTAQKVGKTELGLGRGWPWMRENRCGSGEHGIF